MLRPLPPRLLPLAALWIALSAAPPAPGLEAAVPIAGGFELPTSVTLHPSEDQAFVTEQTGEVWIVDDLGGTPTRLPGAFLDLSDELSDLRFDLFDERGLLQLAFAHDYATSGFLYVLVATTPTNQDGEIQVRRYQSVGGAPVQLATETLLLRVPKPVFPPGTFGVRELYHNGGVILVDSAGILWVAIGDGAGSPLSVDFHDCAQNEDSPVGKIVRIDPSLVPSGGGVAILGPCPELGPTAGISLWARGLRNPWRASFDSQTGDLYIGDVGWTSVEEIDVVDAADVGQGTPNFGWRSFEGDQPNSRYCPGDALCDVPQTTEMPVHTYAHSAGGQCGGSVVGGLVYHGPIAELDGRYVFGDYCKSTISSFTYDGAGGIAGSVVDHTAELDPSGELLRLVDFASTPGGPLYLLDIGDTTDGRIYRVPEPTRGEGALVALGLLLVVRELRRRVGAAVGPAGAFAAAP